MKSNALLASILTGLLPTAATVVLAQPGSLDITFNPGTGVDTAVFGIAVQTNGQVLIGGDFSTYNGESRSHIARVNSDGSLDAALLPLAGPDGTVRAIAPANDGKVVIGGDFYAVNGIPRMFLARLRADASLDLGFPNVLFSGRVTTLERQTDDSYLVVGEFTSINGSPFNRVARLLSGGAVDSGFNPASRTSNGVVRAAAIQPDGKVVLAGDFQSVDNATRMFVARVNANGTLDSSFDAGFIGGSSIAKALIQTDGKIVILGDFSSVNGYSRPGIARVNADGSIDKSFVLPSGHSGITGAVLQPDGKCILGGAFAYLLRVNTNGTLDTAFTPNLNATVTALALQPDGKILVGGYFTRINATNINRIARLNGENTAPAGLQFLSANRYFGTTLSGTVSNTYRIEWTTNLNMPSLWTPLFNVSLETNPQFILDPVPITGRQRFYRAVTLP